MMTQPYMITNEFSMQEVIRHFDTNLIFHTIEDKLDSIDYTATLPQVNIVKSFEDEFNYMTQEYPGDANNIRQIRLAVYTEIIEILTAKFNLKYNVNDESIDLYRAAFMLYDFIISNRNKYLVDFFTAFIMNNKDSLYNQLQADPNVKHGRDISSNYGKIVYTDPKYITISANMPRVLDYVKMLDVRLVDIFMSVYPDISVMQFMDNAFADKGNFFYDHYCSILNMPEVLPVIIVNIKMNLQQYVGNLTTNNMEDLVNLTKE